MCRTLWISRQRPFRTPSSAPPLSPCRRTFRPLTFRVRCTLTASPRNPHPQHSVHPHAIRECISLTSSTRRSASSLRSHARRHRHRNRLPHARRYAARRAIAAAVTCWSLACSCRTAATGVVSAARETSAARRRRSAGVRPGAANASSNSTSPHCLPGQLWQAQTLVELNPYFQSSQFITAFYPFYWKLLKSQFFLVPASFFFPTQWISCSWMLLINVLQSKCFTSFHTNPNPVFSTFTFYKFKEINKCKEMVGWIQNPTHHFFAFVYFLNPSHFYLHFLFSRFLSLLSLLL